MSENASGEEKKLVAIVRAGDFVWGFASIQGEPKTVKAVVLPHDFKLTEKESFMVRIRRGGRLSPQAVGDRGMVGFCAAEIPPDFIGFKVVGMGKAGTCVFLEPIRGSLEGLKAVYEASVNFGADHGVGPIDAYERLLAMVTHRHEDGTVGSTKAQDWYDAVDHYGHDIAVAQQEQEQAVAEAPSD